MKRARLAIRPDCTDDYFNYRFRRARIEAGYTFAGLAETIGITTAGVYAYERLHCLPDEGMARKLADAVGKPVDYLFPEVLKKHAKEIRRERKGAIKFPYGSRLNPVLLGDLSERSVIDEQKPEDAAVNRELQESLDDVLSTLRPHEQLVVRQFYGLGVERHTLREIGKGLHLSKQRISQIGIRAIAKLQKRGKNFERLRAFLG